MKPKSTSNKDASVSIGFLKKICGSLSQIFEEECSVELRPKLEKNLGLSFENNFLFFGPKIFDLAPIEIVISVFHEIVHYFHFKKGIKDVGTNFYHNKIFRDKCLQKGLFVLKHKNQGWSLILTEYPRNVIDPQSVFEPNIKDFLKTKEVLNSILNDNDWQRFYAQRFIFSKKENSFKYTCACPPPFNSVRSGRGPKSPNPPSFQCLICEQIFTCKNG